MLDCKSHSISASATKVQTTARTSQSPELEEEDYSDRREYPRLLKPPAEVSGGWSRVCDVSLGGICLEGNSDLEQGDQCSLIITDGLLFYTQTLDAEVMWRRGKRVGLRWVGLDERQRAWLHSRYHAWKEEASRPQLVAAPYRPPTRGMVFHI